MCEEKWNGDKERMERGAKNRKRLGDSDGCSCKMNASDRYISLTRRHLYFQIIGEPVPSCTKVNRMWVNRST